MIVKRYAVGSEMSGIECVVSESKNHDILICGSDGSGLFELDADEVNDFIHAIKVLRKAKPKMTESTLAAIEADKKVSFEKALRHAKAGFGIRLTTWAPDVVIRVQRPDANSKMTAPYLYVESRFGKVPWKETMIELFAENWEIVQ